MTKLSKRKKIFYSIWKSTEKNTKGLKRFKEVSPSSNFSVGGIKNESLENIKEKNDQQTMNNFLETLNSVRKYQNEYLELGVERVNKYLDSVEGDWLESW